MKQSRRNKIGLLGPFSFGNLGNAALQQVLVQNLRRHFPEAEFYGCCVDPEGTADANRILPFPLNRNVPWPDAPATSSGTDGISDSRRPENPIGVRPSNESKLSGIGENMRAVLSERRKVSGELRFCGQAHRFLKDFRLIVYGLGGLFDEVWGGKWGDLYSYFRWAVLARLAGVPLACLSVGVEEVNTRIGRFFCKTTLMLAGYRSFRDVESRKKAEAMGVRRENRVFPDLAFGLEMGDHREAEHARRGTVGISPMPYCDPRFWPIKKPLVYQAYLAKLASFVAWLLRNGYKVVVFPTQIRMDRAAIDELKAAALQEAPAPSHAHLTEAIPRNVDDCLALLSGLDLVVTSRLHGVILAQLAATPVLAVSPASKIDRLMEDMCLEEYVLKIREFDLPALVDRFKKLEANRESVRRTTRSKVEQYRWDVDKQFDLLFSAHGFLDVAQ